MEVRLVRKEKHLDFFAGSLATDDCLIVPFTKLEKQQEKRIGKEKKMYFI